MQIKSRNPNILISIDKGEIFEGTLSEWENSFGYLSNLDDEQVIDYIYDWAYEEGFNVEVMSSFDEDYWLESLPEASLKMLTHLYNHWKTSSEYQRITYRSEVIGMIETELKNRHR